MWLEVDAEVTSREVMLYVGQARRTETTPCICSTGSFRAYGLISHWLVRAAVGLSRHVICSWFCLGFRR